jgi:hypothetical protein
VTRFINLYKANITNDVESVCDVVSSKGPQMKKDAAAINSNFIHTKLLHLRKVALVYSIKWNPFPYILNKKVLHCQGQW